MGKEKLSDIVRKQSTQLQRAIVPRVEHFQLAAADRFSRAVHRLRWENWSRRAKRLAYAGALVGAAGAGYSFIPTADVAPERTLSASEARTYQEISAAIDSAHVHDLPLYMALAHADTGRTAPEVVARFDSLREHFLDERTLLQRSEPDARDLAVFAYKLGPHLERSKPFTWGHFLTGTSYDMMLEASLAADRPSADSTMKVVPLRTSAISSLPRPVRQEAHSFYHAVKENEINYHWRIRNFRRNPLVVGEPEVDLVEKYAWYRPPVDVPFDVIVDGLTMTQKYGASRSGGRRRHQGVDVMCEFGDPVYPITASRIEKLERWNGKSSNGHTIRFRTAYGDVVSYLHMDSFEPGVKEGDYVGQHTVIGRCGDTGNARGNPHVHVQVYMGGDRNRPVNPITYFGESSPAALRLRESTEKNPRHYQEFFERVDAFNKAPQVHLIGRK